MTTDSDNGLTTDLEVILAAMIADPTAAARVASTVLSWMEEHSETVGDYPHAYMAALAVRDGVAAIDSGGTPPADEEMVGRLRAVPVAEATAVALHVICGHSISDTADMVRRPDYEVAGLVADFLAPRPAPGEAGVSATGSADPPPTRTVGQQAAPAAAPATSVGYDHRAPATPAPPAPAKADPPIRKSLLIALAAVIAIAVILLVFTRLSGESDAAVRAAARPSEVTHELSSTGIAGPRGTDPDDGATLTRWSGSLSGTAAPTPRPRGSDELPR